MPRNSLAKMLARTQPLPHPDFTEPCLIWQGAKDRDGYGKTAIDGKDRRAHRLVWELVFGSINPNLEIDHRCKRPACIEITHLDQVSRRLNWERSDCPSSISRRKNQCYAGHDLDEHGYVNPRTGRRSCRECKREWQRAYRRRKSADV